MATEWSLDFCLVCDRQTLGGAYCSQPCRLAELDRSSPADSEPSSPTAWGYETSSAAGLHLTPAFDFAAYKSAATPYYRSLTPSSSETSLSSLQSSTSSSRSSPVSDQARNELRDYASSFDHVRDWKRRLTTSWTWTPRNQTHPPLLRRQGQPPFRYHKNITSLILLFYYSVLDSWRADDPRRRPIYPLVSETQLFLPFLTLYKRPHETKIRPKKKDTLCSIPPRKGHNYTTHTHTHPSPSTTKTFFQFYFFSLDIIYLWLLLFALGKRTTGTTAWWWNRFIFFFFFFCFIFICYIWCDKGFERLLTFKKKKDCYYQHFVFSRDIPQVKHPYTYYLYMKETTVFWFFSYIYLSIYIYIYMLFSPFWTTFPSSDYGLWDHGFMQYVYVRVVGVHLSCCFHRYGLRLELWIPPVWNNFWLLSCCISVLVIVSVLHRSIALTLSTCSYELSHSSTISRSPLPCSFTCHAPFTQLWGSRSRVASKSNQSHHIFILSLLLNLLFFTFFRPNHLSPGKRLAAQEKK